MTPPPEEWDLPTRRLGRRVHVFDRLDSTNDRAALLAADPAVLAAGGVCVLADEQTSGRGQYGRSWVAAPRSSVLLSVLLFPPAPLRRPAVLTAWAAVSVCGLIRATTGLAARIKWPNDVLLRGRKVCGILTESRVQRAEPGAGTAGLAVVVGIGLNVKQSPAEFAVAGLPLATSLAQFTSAALDSRAVAGELILKLDEEYDLLCRGELAALESSWQGYLGLLGKQVAAECPDAQGGRQIGRLCGLTFEAVELEQPDGFRRVLRPETVQHLDEV